MEPLRPLRDVLAGLAGDEHARLEHGGDLSGLLAAEGYPELPDDLVAEAVISYADTAPAEVAEHLAPFVTANSPVPLDDLAADPAGPAEALDLLATAPTELSTDEAPVETDDDLADDTLPDLVVDDEVFSLDFGEGDAAAVEASAADAADAAEESAGADEAAEPAEAPNGTAGADSEIGGNGALFDLELAEDADDQADDDVSDF